MILWRLFCLFALIFHTSENIRRKCIWIPGLNFYIWVNRIWSRPELRTWISVWRQWKICWLHWTKAIMWWPESTIIPTVHRSFFQMIRSLRECRKMQTTAGLWRCRHILEENTRWPEWSGMEVTVRIKLPVCRVPFWWWCWTIKIPGRHWHWCLQILSAVTVPEQFRESGQNIWQEKIPKRLPLSDRVLWEEPVCWLF